MIRYFLTYIVFCAVVLYCLSSCSAPNQAQASAWTYESEQTWDE